MTKLKPESLKFIVIGIVLFLLLIFILFGGSNQQTPIVEREYSTSVKVINESSDGSVLNVEERDGENRIVVFDPMKTNEEIQNSIGIDETKLQQTELKVPGIAMGRYDPENKQVLIDDLYLENYYETVFNSNYGD